MDRRRNLPKAIPPIQAPELIVGRFTPETHLDNLNAMGHHMLTIRSGKHAIYRCKHCSKSCAKGKLQTWSSRCTAERGRLVSQYRCKRPRIDPPAPIRELAQTDGPPSSLLGSSGEWSPELPKSGPVGPSVCANSRVGAGGSTLGFLHRHCDTRRPRSAVQRLLQVCSLPLAQDLLQCLHL